MQENNDLLRTLVELVRALVALLSTRAARQAQLDEARAEEDREIEAVRTEARSRKATRRPAEGAPAG